MKVDTSDIKLAADKIIPYQIGLRPENLGHTTGRCIPNCTLQR